MPRSPPVVQPPVFASLLLAGREEAAAVLERLGTTPAGLTATEAARRLATSGPNQLGEQAGDPRLAVLRRAVANPLVVLLATLAAASFLAGDPVPGSMMLVMMAIGVGIRFVQESRAHASAAALRSMIVVHATVVRDGVAAELPIRDLVPGDIVRLAAGDMVPADVRVLSCKDLFVTQAMLTGESFPVEKFAAPDGGEGGEPLELRSVCFMGTSVESGTAEAVVVETGRSTLLGGVSKTLDLPEQPTAFDVGMARFTWFMVTVVAVMVPLVFVLNGLTKGDWWNAFFFALAVAVGLTPEMLPMIVAVCLSRGAVSMAEKRVIVKHIDSIQNLGGMDVLCTDKTGTLTLDRILLERHCDVRLREDRQVLELAWLNSHFQTGLRNLLDRAILDHERLRERVPHEGYAKLDEIPFDFSRRMMSVVVSCPEGGRRLICKGAPDEVFTRCTAYEVDGLVHPVSGGLPAALVEECSRLGAEGFRVLAVATRDVPPRDSYSHADEQDLVLRGYVAFLDPPKDSAADAIVELQARGVAVMVLTGDSDLVSRTICAAVGLDVRSVLVGHEIEALDDAALAAALRGVNLCARLSPGQKQRVVRVLRRAGHVVGFLGDGANDAPALREADVGISVDSAVDIARESADCILLDKDLRVLGAGVVEGRKVFVNVLKYIRMGASSNFGNMLSVLAASVFVPFLPMTPLQILANNLLYDCSQVPIPTDEVDPELVARPRPWSLKQVTRFILLLGPCSSLFDFLTFAALMHLFGCGDASRAAVFQSGWFVESLLTQTFIIHVIRTDRIPFLRSHASLALTATTAMVMAIGVWLPGSPLGRLLGFAALPPGYWPFVIVIVAGYAATAYAVKRWLVRHAWLD